MYNTNKEIDIIQTLKPYNPKSIGLFGSVARNKETAPSDIDILDSTTNYVGFIREISNQSHRY